MPVLVGSNSDGWNRKGYVALLAGSITECRYTLAELVEVLKQSGVQSSDVRLSDANDHTWALSEAERAEFWTLWNGES